MFLDIGAAFNFLSDKSTFNDKLGFNKRLTLKWTSIDNAVTLRCKAIRGCIFGVGAGCLGLRARISWDKTRGHATHGYQCR